MFRPLPRPRGYSSWNTFDFLTIRFSVKTRVKTRYKAHQARSSIRKYLVRVYRSMRRHECLMFQNYIPLLCLIFQNHVLCISHCVSCSKTISHYCVFCSKTISHSALCSKIISRCVLCSKIIAGMPLYALSMHQVPLMVSRFSSVQAKHRLSCTLHAAGGCEQWTPDIAQCYNMGSDGTDASWKCEASMPEGYSFSSVEVSSLGLAIPLKTTCY